ncbi:hypothetical protein [Leuconostoc mesenteroides]|uniref:hypothetical protein n=1 Tax=Leuconostoc mesenteroides TaxID=1245 RepID=UPI00235FC53B|nr:hypothetical protein [Leuconostoc mesenteroides]
MIEIGHNLQHAIEFGALLSAMVAVTYIVLKFVTKIIFSKNQYIKKFLPKERTEIIWSWLEKHPGTVIGCCWLLVPIISIIYATILLL